MAIDVTKITQGRQEARDKANNAGSEARYVLEMQHIADSLEAIRGELVGMSHLVAAIAQKPAPRG